MGVKRTPAMDRRAELSAREAQAERYKPLQRGITTTLPNAAEYAWRLPLDVAAALRGAYIDQTSTGPCWRISTKAEAALKECRLFGLVDMGSPFLTVFGTHVRKALIEDHGE